MQLEGFFFKGKRSFSNTELNQKYDELIISDTCYMGAKSGSEVKIFSSNYFGIISDPGNKETKCLSDSKTQNFVSFSLEDSLAKQQDNSIGVCAWYDQQVEKLYLSRDAFGLIPFYYFQLSNQIVAFSTDLVSLITNPFIKQHIRLNTQRLAIYGTVLADAATPYVTDTFYEQIQSVPPGHIVTLDFQNVTRKPHTIFRPSKWSHLTRVEEFGEEFRAMFLNSVKRKLRPESQVLASHLSGGMDSSSVCTAIKYLNPEQTLQTLYNKSNTLDTDENLYAVSVAKKIGSVHHETLQSDEDFRLLSTFIPLAGQPSSTLISPSATASLMHFAKDLGCNTIFNGTGGDSIVGSGLELTGMAFDKHQWSLVDTLAKKRSSFYSLAGKYSNWDNYSAEKKHAVVLNNLFYDKLSELAVQRNWRGFFKLFNEVSSNFNISYSDILRKGGKSLLGKIKKGHFAPITSILNEDLIALPRQYNSQNVRGLLEAGHSEEHHQALLDVYNTHTIFSNEHAFTMCRHYNITNSSPFYDKNLFELCMAVPDIVKFGDGIGRAHFREAMKGLLPENVRRRTTKTHVRSIGQQIVHRLHYQAQDILTQNSEVWNYVDRRKFEVQVGILKNDKIPYQQKNNTLFLISRTISLAIWLEWYKRNR